MHTILAVFLERGLETFQIPIVRPIWQPPKGFRLYRRPLGASVYSLPGAGRSPWAPPVSPDSVVLEDPLRQSPGCDGDIWEA